MINRRTIFIIVLFIVFFSINIYAGNNLSVDTFKINLLSFFIRPVFLFTGFVSLFIFALRFKEKDYSFLYFGLFVLMSAIPELDESFYFSVFPLPQKHFLLYTISPPYCTIIFFILFTISTFGAGWKNILNYLWKINLAGLIISITLHFMPVKIESKVLILTFLIIAFISSIVIFIIILKSEFYKKLRNNLVFRTSIVAFVCISIISIFLAKNDKSEGLFLIGVLFLSFGMMNILVVKFMAFIQDAANYKIELERNKIELLEARQANLQAQYESLKGQINPHFLFNSLNALSSLCYPKPNPEKAKKFIDEFSKIFRYILEIQDKTVIELRSELEFLNSYYYLQKIRFDKDLQLQISIDNDKYNMLLPPLTLQVLVENAIKHNQVKSETPLKVTIENFNNVLHIRNNLQRRNKINVPSTKIGQENLIKRYQLISELTPEFYEKNNQYIAKIPLLNDEYDKSPDN